MIEHAAVFVAGVAVVAPFLVVLWVRLRRLRREVEAVASQEVPVEWLPHSLLGVRTAMLESALLVQADPGKLTMDEMSDLHGYAAARRCRHVFFVQGHLLALGLREPESMLPWRRRKPRVAEVVS